jgi:N-methylhydantoinase A
VAESSGHRDQITFDMGGTSTDICLIHDGRPTLAREPEFDGRPLRVPQLDIHTIGSGGGSIAWVSAGLLHVGPQSAGAQPGPACYGRGGSEPTVTDAHVVLGRVDPDHFLGGEMRLDRDRSHAAVARVADPLGLSVEEAALGILDIAEAQMARGIRVVSVNRGFDPRSFTLVAYGGAGPMHAFAVGRLVDVGSVLIPKTPGAFSALGLVNADVKYDLVRIVARPIGELRGEDVEELAAPLVREAQRRLAALGERTMHPRLVRTVRFRYAWQENDVEVVIGDEPITQAAFADAVDRFHEQHDFEFGYSNPEDQVELIAVCLEAYGPLPRTDGSAAATVTGSTPDPVRVRKACFRAGWVDTRVFVRASLPAGAELHGPAVIEEREATTIVPPGASVLVDRQLNLVLREEATE